MSFLYERLEENDEEMLKRIEKVLERDYSDAHDSPMLYISLNDIRWLVRRTRTFSLLFN